MINNAYNPNATDPEFKREEDAYYVIQKYKHFGTWLNPQWEWVDVAFKSGGNRFPDKETAESKLAQIVKKFNIYDFVLSRVHHFLSYRIVFRNTLTVIHDTPIKTKDFTLDKKFMKTKGDAK